MSEVTIESITKALRKQISKTAGDDGEQYAQDWLENSGWEFQKVDQSRGSLSRELRQFGGKRPDFIADPGDGVGVLLIDAKYVSTENLTFFRLQDMELRKYRKLVEYCEASFPDTRFDLAFMVFPKEEDGQRLVWVHVDEFKNGQMDELAGEPATKVALDNRDDLWCEIG